MSVTVHVYICVYVCVPILYIYVYISVSLCVYLFLCVYVCICVCLCVSKSLCVSMCVCPGWIPPSSSDFLGYFFLHICQIPKEKQKQGKGISMLCCGKSSSGTGEKILLYSSRQAFNCMSRGNCHSWTQAEGQEQSGALTLIPAPEKKEKKRYSYSGEAPGLES